MSPVEDQDANWHLLDDPLKSHNSNLVDAEEVKNSTILQIVLTKLAIMSSSIFY